MRKFILKSIIALIFVILFDGMFFLGHDIHQCPDSVWAAFAGVNIAYLSLFLIPLLTPKRDGVAVLSGTLYLIGIFYFLAELTAGVTFLFWIQDTMFLPVLVQGILFAVYIVILLMNVLANDATISSLNRQETLSDRRHQWMNEVRAVKEIVALDKKTEKIVERCYDDLSGCSISTSPEVSDVENEINTAVMLMKDYAQDGNLAEVAKIAMNIRALVSKRNNKLYYKRNY